MAYIASLQKEVLSINNLFREHLKSFGFDAIKSPAQCVGLSAISRLLMIYNFYLQLKRFVKLKIN